jgi:hypothetical protein
MTTMRRDWRETARAAADLALLGFLVTGAALPVVTAGAAVAAGSAAVHHHLEHDTWPSPRASWAAFRGALGPGLLAVAAIGVVVLDFLALRSGAVPGGLPLTVVLIGLAVLAAGMGGLAVVTAAARPDGMKVLGAAAALAGAHPGTLLAVTAVVVLVVFLALLIHPVLVPVLVGYALFALHVVVRRTAP